MPKVKDWETMAKVLGLCTSIVVFILGICMSLGIYAYHGDQKVLNLHLTTISEDVKEIKRTQKTSMRELSYDFEKDINTVEELFQGHIMRVDKEATEIRSRIRDLELGKEDKR